MGGSHGKSKAPAAKSNGNSKTSAAHYQKPSSYKKPSATASSSKPPAASKPPTRAQYTKPSTSPAASPPSSPKQDGGLLDWVNTHTAKHGVRVKNFTSDWKDGKAICALAAGIRPNTLNYTSAVSGGTNLARIKKGIAALEKAGCPMLVDADDFGIESKSMMTYISDVRRRLC